MGTYRYLLAVLVLLSHCGYLFHGYNQGVIAVVSFFLISGYVINLLINTHYQSNKDIFYFYLDRSLRLFPQFLFYLVATIFLLAFYGEMGVTKTFYKIVINLTMVPLNFFAIYNDSFIIVPQSWSLGLEMQFYLIIPIILAFKLVRKCAWLSFIFALVAYSQIVNPDYYGYRMISGTLFIFLIGSMLTNPKENNKTIITLYLLSIIVFITSIIINRASNIRTIEVLLGLIIGLPIVHTLVKKRIKHKIDVILGNLSYGVYLNHMMISFFLKKNNIDISNPYSIILIIALSTSMSFISYVLIEKPLYKLRHKVRAHYGREMQENIDINTPIQKSDQ
ncbi:acyltransferase family protein [Serratia liquefaciens]|uniref:acyltransferase family protein n=1 Tax=Serratia liquefaciens TaxID=614 RepID=UPI0034D7443C